MKVRVHWTAASLGLMLALMLSAVFASGVSADDAAPPAEETAPAEVPVEPAAATEEPALPADEPAATEVPVEPAAAAEEPALEPAAILAEIPESTDLVVLDETGDPLSLATEEAAAAFIAGDPTWCPGTVLPGNASCITGDDPTSMNSLLTKLDAVDATGAGTIYIAYDYNSSADSDFSLIDGANLAGLTDLTLQGGYGAPPLEPRDPEPISLLDTLRINWDSGSNNNLTINDLAFGYELGVDGVAGDLTLNNVEVGFANQAYILDVDGTVRVADSDFHNNNYEGLVIRTAGDVEITDSSFNNNQSYGASGLVMAYYAGSDPMNVTLNNVTATGNSFEGVWAVSHGDMVLNGGDFSHNGRRGLRLLVLNDNDLTLNNVLIEGNGNMGGWLTVATGSDPYSGSVSPTACIRVHSGAVRNNGAYGLNLAGNTFIDNVTFSGNGIANWSAPGYSVSTDGGPCDDTPDIPEPPVVPPPAGESQAVTSAGPACADSLLDEGEVTALLHDLCGVTVAFEHVAALDVPAALPEGTTFGFGVTLEADAFPTGGTASLSFPVPDGADADSLVVLLWNGSQWIEVAGGALVDGEFVVTVNAAGVYVLAVRS